MIGIVHSVNPIQSILIKSSNANKDRRYITIVDEGGSLIQVSLWGKNTRDYDLSEGQVIAIKGARVSDYNGKSINSGDEHSQIFIDPKHKRAKELK